MTHDPVTKKVLDDRYEYPVVNGPSWERLCDALKYSNVREMGVTFTWVDQEGREQETQGRVCSIEGSAHYPGTNPVVGFIPAYSAYPVLLQINYWPNHRKGHVVNVRRRERFARKSSSPAST